MPVIKTTKIYKDIETAHRNGYTTVSLQGSSRSGKTYNAVIWLIKYCLKAPGTRLSIVRATLPALKGSVYIDFKEILMNMLLFDEKALNKSELIYTLPNKSWVEFFSTDSEQKLRGRKRDILFVNEANEITYLEYQQLKIRTSGLVVLDYNPSFSDDHWLCSVNKEPSTLHTISTYRDNPFLEQTIIDRIESLRGKSESLWRIYGLGQQAVIEGLVFKNVNTIDAIPEHITRRWVGMDFGFTNDPTAIIELAATNENLYIHQLCYRTHMLTSDIIRELKSKRPASKIISESADPRLIQEIFRAGLNIHPVKKYPDSIKAGIAKMQEYNIFITKDSPDVIKEFRNYTYEQDKEGKWLNTPIDYFNHAIDAARYIVMQEIMGGERRPIDKGRIAAAVY